MQSLHNARLMCPAATFYRKGSAFQDCLGRSVAWPGVVRACYHNSRLRSSGDRRDAGAAIEFSEPWHQQVDAYIVFTEFYRQEFIGAGLPGEKLFVKPHFLVTDPGMKKTTGDYVLFLGRLAPEKGIPTLLKAWRSLRHIPLRIAGEGPMEGDVKQFAEKNPSVCALPHLSRKECFDLIKGARFLVWPSEGYNETFGLVAIEAFACGTPVIAARMGAMKEIVTDHWTGLHFTPGDPHDLASKVSWAWSHPTEMESMGGAARSEYKAKYTAEINYQLLMEIYSRARGATARKAA